METLNYYIRPETFPLNATLSRSLCTVASSFSICCLMYSLSTFFAMFTTTYRLRLRGKERVFWHVTAIRAVFGLWSIREGIHGLMSEELYSNVALAVTPRSTFLFHVTMGFFLFESITVSLADLIHGRWQLLLNLHHWMAFMGYFVGWYYQRFHFMASAALILECSTPFSGLCWVLIKCGLSKTLLWRVNQMLMIHAFHCRSIMECYFWYVSWKHWDVISLEYNTVPFWTMYVQLCLVSLLMTPYWTYKKTVQFVTGDDWNFIPNAQHQQNNGDAVQVRDKAE